MWQQCFLGRCWSESFSSLKQFIDYQFFLIQPIFSYDKWFSLPIMTIKLRIKGKHNYTHRSSNMDSLYNDLAKKGKYRPEHNELRNYKWFCTLKCSHSVSEELWKTWCFFQENSGEIFYKEITKVREILKLNWSSWI
jgi:hypothetical protein